MWQLGPTTCSWEMLKVSRWSVWIDSDWKYTLKRINNKIKIKSIQRHLTQIPSRTHNYWMLNSHYQEHSYDTAKPREVLTQRTLTYGRAISGMFSDSLTLWMAVFISEKVEGVKVSGACCREWNHGSQKQMHNLLFCYRELPLQSELWLAGATNPSAIRVFQTNHLETVLGLEPSIISWPSAQQTRPRVT